MAHPTRGHISHTYDITEVLGVDADTLTIRYRDAAHATPQSVTLNVVQRNTVARQMLEAMAQSLRVHGDGDWESAYALAGRMATCAKVCDDLTARGVHDIADPAVDLPLLRAVIEPYTDSTKRTLNKLLARILRANNAEGAPLARALTNTTYMVKESTTEPYSDEQADEIEAKARACFIDAVKAQRELLTELGVDTSGRAWLAVPAEDIVAQARRQYAHLAGTRPPGGNAARAELIAWCLLNPAAFARTRSRARKAPRPSIDAIGSALYPGVSVLVSGLVLQCLAEEIGLNLSTLLRTEPDDLVITGETNASLRVLKARNRSDENVAVRTESMFSAGGLVQTLTGLTRFSRLHRRTALPEGSEVADRVYVEHVEPPADSQVLPSSRLQQGWRLLAATAADPHPSLRFRALRAKALERAVRKDPNADVHGHSQQTRQHYLENVFPQSTLADLATAAQDTLVDSASSAFASHTTGIAANQRDFLDVGVGVCANAGADPDDRTKPCSLGITACFTCPNGYRTAESVPGLLAAKRYAEIIRDNDPDEWGNGEAATLHYYATRCLEEYPLTVVATAEATDLTPLIVTINGLYTELRR